MSPGGQLKARGVRRDICRQKHVSTLSFNSALKKKKNLNPAQNRDQNREVNTVKVMKKRDRTTRVLLRQHHWDKPHAELQN